MLKQLRGLVKGNDEKIIDNLVEIIYYYLWFYLDAKTNKIVDAK